MDATVTTATTGSSMIFIDIDTLKARLGVQKIDIVRNPNTGKLFGSTERGNLKVEQALTAAKTIKFMYESEDKFNEGCLVNTVPATPPVMVL